MTQPTAAIALHRFGLGARPGEAASIADPLAWLEAQIVPDPGVPEPLRVYPSSVQVWNLWRSRKGKGMEGMERMSGYDFRRTMRRFYLREVDDRVRNAALTDDHFTERLVWFWSNHFTVSTAFGAILLGPHATAFEREAIRPHVYGRFRDMLVAVARQPAMLSYLDNDSSFGPNSQAGRAQGRGLNENYGREVLELHTVGVDGGYDQRDVIALATILTGWRPSDEAVDPESDSAFRFQANAHEPGEKSLLGVAFGEGGEADGLAALDMLAARPQTARFVATKLARHFIADVPPPEAVDALAETFLETGGDLAAVTRRLIRLESAWAPGRTKLRTPVEMMVATGRALGADGSEPWLARPNRTLRSFDNLPFAAPSPAGWPDTADAWMGPEALLERLEWCTAAAVATPVSAPPADWARDILGEQLRPETAERMAAEGDPATAVAMLLVSPDFQWR